MFRKFNAWLPLFIVALIGSFASLALAQDAGMQIPDSPVDVGAGATSLFSSYGTQLVAVIAVILAFAGIRMLVKWARGGYRSA